MHRTLVKALIAGTVVVAAAFAAVAPATAQYPAVAGAIQVTTNVNNALVGSTISWTCTILDTNGNPIAGVPCQVDVTDEPGDDVAIGSKTVTKITDANGQTTGPLFVGTTLGEITLTATYLDLEAQTIVNVFALQAPFLNQNNPGVLAGLFAPKPQAQGTAGQQTAPVVQPGIRPPSTGDAGLASGDTSPALLLVGGLAALSVAGISGLRLARTRA